MLGRQHGRKHESNRLSSKVPRAPNIPNDTGCILAARAWSSSRNLIPFTCWGREPPSRQQLMPQRTFSLAAAAAAAAAAAGMAAGPSLTSIHKASVVNHVHLPSFTHHGHDVLLNPKHSTAHRLPRGSLRATGTPHQPTHHGHGVIVDHTHIAAHRFQHWHKDTLDDRHSASVHSPWARCHPGPRVLLSRGRCPLQLRCSSWCRPAGGLATGEGQQAAGRPMSHRQTYTR
eukprot:scaffold13034_cov20-Tisochrysis_lutea.AAC.5